VPDDQRSHQDLWSPGGLSCHPGSIAQAPFVFREGCTMLHRFVGSPTSQATVQSLP
jgi:hypothetical protein